ncbi:FecR domain-containing protein [Olivibacter sp. SDN3]|uniref:FecR family protein n=1 Tax=Olivibacter sp. SDN3 TaxID=2764720 RepID=UPI001651365B|nr:FecR domain-containing protein [Olivibacter sp. SDN3]QNL49144.1 FecR domain-containing protein [Olivibacter sp. SDN3]
MNKRRNITENIKNTLENARAEKLTTKEKEQLWASIVTRTIDSPVLKRHRRRSVGWLSVAMAAVFFGAFYFFYHYKKTDVDIVVIAKTNKMHFRDTGEVQLLDADKRSHELMADSVVNYTDAADLHETVPVVSKQNKQSRFSSINVPYGKRTEVLLEDGSKIWLNAGSTLTFPEQFAGNQREVYLEGEGYFEVKHEANRPFIVRSDYMDINVLGTTFNLSVYANDQQHTAVLLSGNIEVHETKESHFDKKILEPGTMAAVDRKKGTIAVKEAAIEESISWTKRQLLLNQTPLSEIVKKLERVYNTKILDHTGLPAADTFSGSLDLSQPLLAVLQHVYDQEEYAATQIERRVYIKRK